MRAVLQGASEQILLGPGGLTIGRTTDNQLVVADAKASSHHAVIKLSPQGYSLSDLGSTNGTFVNERRLDAHMPHILNIGDKLRIGDTTFTYDEIEVVQQVSDSAPTIAATGPYGYTEYGKEDAAVANQPAQLAFPPSSPPYPQPQPSYGQNTPSSPAQPSYGESVPFAPVQPSYGQNVPSSPMQPPYGQGISLSAPTHQYDQRTVAAPMQPAYMPPTPPEQQQPYMPGSPAAFNYDQGTVAAMPPTPFSPDQQPYTPGAPAAFNQSSYAPSMPFQQPYAAAAGPASYPPPSPVQQPYMPPPQVPYAAPPAQQKKAGGLNRILLIVLIVVIVLGLGGGGAAWYFLTRPQPVISVTSTYKVGTTPAGSTGTVLHFSGQKFSNSSAVSFLLDGKPMPGVASTQSDANGNVKADLTVTTSWSMGDHQVSAKDAGGYAPKIDQKITIVAQGQAGTPGPNGAPADNSSFAISVNVQTQNSSSGNPTTGTLAVTGKPDPAGGTVCEKSDDGQPHTSNGSSNGLTFTGTVAATCAGTYKAGKLTYTETVTTMHFVYSNGFDCTAQTPFPFQQLTGTFTSATAINGNYTTNSVTLTCSLNGASAPITLPPQTGTWTGTVATP